MVIHHAGCLHKCIANGGPNKFKTTIFQIFAHGRGFRCGCGKFRYFTKSVLNGFPVGELPDVFVKTAELISDIHE